MIKVIIDQKDTLTKIMANEKQTNKVTNRVTKQTHVVFIKKDLNF